MDDTMEKRTTSRKLWCKSLATGRSQRRRAGPKDPRRHHGESGAPLPDSGRTTTLCCVQTADQRREEVEAQLAVGAGIRSDHQGLRIQRKLQSDEVVVKGDKPWYLPHFGVENPNKPGKVRFVFDAAAKVGGTSLNSALVKGPQHYKPLSAVLFHFRKEAVGVCGDIKEMFHQVLIRQEDRCYQRFLWRDGNDDRDPDVYEMNAITFRAACSPSTAHYVKKVNALKFLDSDPRSVKATIDHHYVDDHVDFFEMVSR
ncbi:uncharacterized protein LOC108104162 [Drosophila eugracilis]|uniref:uncharacterized protein LOC108104162 n=1 Tax=Drosophila eugracilis TaxID=29029 RepID=UPI001BDABE25|nr:uncharacterized protein LOC108104162 [Drosophila eugracilis]